MRRPTEWPIHHSLVESSRLRIGIPWSEPDERFRRDDGTATPLI
jgi:hypothetical protein